MSQAIDLEAAVDEMHAAVLGALPADFLDLTDINVARERVYGFMGMMPAPELPESVDVSEQMVPGYQDDPDVRVKIYRPAGLPAGSPALVWIHGGGMVAMTAEVDDFRCATTAEAHNCLVVSVDYRLAPETAAPGLVNDCFAALSWVSNQAADLGISADRIVIGGASAGGGLAAGTALMARDLNGPDLAAQLLVFPMLDHSNTTPSSHRIVDTRVWNRAANVTAWAAYLGGKAPTAYSSPTTAEDLSGLPPAYINVGSLDMFLDEDIAYAQALNAAGVSAELHVYPGAFHGSNSFVAEHPTSQRWNAEENEFLARALSGNV